MYIFIGAVAMTLKDLTHHKSCKMIIMKISKVVIEMLLVKKLCYSAVVVQICLNCIFIGAVTMTLKVQQ